ncbi:MAG: hypothetical protein ACLTYW_06925 [Collinsella sp.]
MVFFRSFPVIRCCSPRVSLPTTAALTSWALATAWAAAIWAISATL